MFTCSSTNSCFYLESWHCYLKVSYTTGPCLKSHFCLSKIGIKADNVILFSPYLQCTLAEGVFIVRRHCCELAIPKRLRRQQDSSTKLARGSGQQCSGARGNLLAVSLKQGWWRRRKPSSGAGTHGRAAPKLERGRSAAAGKTNICWKSPLSWFYLNSKEDYTITRYCLKWESVIRAARDWFHPPDNCRLRPRNMHAPRTNTTSALPSSPTHPLTSKEL